MYLCLNNRLNIGTAEKTGYAVGLSAVVAGLVIWQCMSNGRPRANEFGVGGQRECDAGHGLREGWMSVFEAIDVF